MSHSKPDPSLEGCQFEISRVPPRASFRKWAYRILSLPFTLPKKIYNTYLLIKCGELREPASKNMCPFRTLNPFRTLFFSFNITIIPELMKAMLKHVRKDPETGLFDDQENEKVFLVLSRDLYESEAIGAGDSLFTCKKDLVQFYRQPILQFIGPNNIKKHGRELERVAQDVLNAFAKVNEPVNATELSLTFTTSVISSLLLGHPGPMESYKNISLANDCLNRTAIKKAWHQPLSKEEKEKYERSLSVMREAIESSLTNKQKPAFGSLVELLQEKMSPIQTKVALFNMYFAGSETSASLLNYILWQLGGHPEYQEAIYREVSGEGVLFDLAEGSQALNRFFAESIRLFTPGYLIVRRAASDLICRAKNREGNVVFEQRIEKDEVLAACPTFAARNPSQFKNPDQFHPGRFAEAPKTLDWRPFGDGAHSCPGQWLAKTEILIFIASLIRQFTFSSLPKEEIGQKGLMTLKPAVDVWVTFSQRENWVNRAK